MSALSKETKKMEAHGEARRGEREDQFTDVGKGPKATPILSAPSVPTDIAGGSVSAVLVR